MSEQPALVRMAIGDDLSLLLDAARAVLRSHSRAVSRRSLQRRIRVGFAKADHLLWLLEQEGVISWKTFGKFERIAAPGELDAVLERIRKAAGDE